MTSPKQETNKLEFSEAKLPAREDLIESIQELSERIKKASDDLNRQTTRAKEYKQELVEDTAKKYLVENHYGDIQDPLLKLAIGEFLQPSLGDKHHHCSCGTRADEYLDTAREQGLREFVEYITPRRDCEYYTVPKEKLEEARDHLIKTQTSEYQQNSLSRVEERVITAKEELEKLSQEYEETKDKEEIASLMETHNLSLLAAKALKEMPSVEKVKGVTPDIFVAVSSRSKYGNSGGIAMYQDLRVYHHGQTELKSYQWRDQYSADNDRHDLYINEVGAVDLLANNNIRVTLNNREYGSRTVKLSFEAPQSSAQAARSTLSVQDQQAFVENVQLLINEVIQDKHDNWRKHHSGERMPNSVTGRYGPYDQPKLKDTATLKEYGLAVFIVESQIDHRASDRQMRYEVYLLTFDPSESKNIKRSIILEDHSYNDSQGNAAIGLVELNKNEVVLSTRKGLNKHKIQTP